VIPETPLFGQDRAIDAFRAAWATRRLHHAWLLSGPRGVGKGSFARAAAGRILADAAGPPPLSPGLAIEPDHPAARLLAAGSHPDFRLLERLEKPGGGLARNISIGQVRGLAELLSVTTSISPWRVIVIDSVDDLETEAANALLKMLEEPPANTVFLLVSHAAGRLLPTIRSRCRRLDFTGLGDDVMTPLLANLLTGRSAEEIAALVALAAGSVGRALRAADLDLAPLEAEARALMSGGDPDNSRRARLAQTLSTKAAGERYAAFLDLVPALIAREARGLTGSRRVRALDAYRRARQTASTAGRRTSDPGFTVFHLGGILASIA
jgi:DNA polymerase-3 subunit delta'